MGGNPSQYLAALSAAFSTLLALRLAEEQGIGQQVDFSIFESQVTSHAQAMVEVSYYGEETGSRAARGSGAGRRVLAKDGPVMFSAQEQQMWRLARLVGAPEELARPNPMDRGAGRAALQEYVERWAAARTGVEFYEQGQAAHVPASYVASPSDLLTSPQYRHRGFFLKIHHPEVGDVDIPGLPFNWDGAAATPLPAPLLGQHNEEVYSGLLGLTNGDLVQLAGAGVI
jgi:formyl-CoA transferase